MLNQMHFFSTIWINYVRINFAHVKGWCMMFVKKGVYNEYEKFKIIIDIFCKN